MATDKALELVEFDNIWGISTAGIFSLYREEGVSYAMVTIPVNQINGMSHEDIGKMVELLVPKAKELAHSETLHNKKLVEEQKQRVYNSPKKPTTGGWVYILKDPYGHYKIGMTTRTPGERLCEFAPQLPFEVEFLFAIEVDDAGFLETTLHDKFNNKRVNGEWFSLDKKDVEYMRGLI